MLHILTCVVIQVATCPLVKACLSIRPPNRRSDQYDSKFYLNWTCCCWRLYMPIILWTNYFLEAQGYGHQDTILYQDNQSAILLEKNGHKSSSKRTKHLNCCFYFSPIVSIPMNSLSSTVLPKRWLVISIPSLCKANSFTSSANLSWTYRIDICHHVFSQECVGQSYLFYIIDTPWFLIPHSFTDTYVHISNRITTGRKNQSAPFSWTSKDGFQSTTRDMNDLFLEALSGVFKKHPELFAVDIKSTSDLFDQYNVFRSFWRGSESRAVAKKVTTNQTATSCIGRWKRKEAAGANQVSHNIDQHYKTRKLVRLTRQH